MDYKTMELSPFSDAKVLCHLERLTTKTGQGPVTATVDITNVCNHNCIWCHSAKYHLAEPGHMPVELFRRLVDSLVKLNTKALSISGGGEPTCHPQVNEMLEYALESGLEVSMVTNGGLLDRINRNLLDRLRYLRVSLDAGSKETHNRLHRPKNQESSWEKIIYNISNLCYNKPRKLCLGVGYLLHPINTPEVSQVTELLRDLGVDYFQVRPIKFTRPIDTETVRQAFEVAKQYETKDFHIVESGYKYEKQVGKTEKCHLLPLVVNISPQGNVNPCCELRGNLDYSYGCLASKSFEEIWFGEKRKRVLSKLNPSLCPDCKYAAMNKFIEEILTDDPLHRNFL